MQRPASISQRVRTFKALIVAGSRPHEKEQAGSPGLLLLLRHAADEAADVLTAYFVSLLLLPVP